MKVSYQMDGFHNWVIFIFVNSYGNHVTDYMQEMAQKKITSMVPYDDINVIT